MEALALNFKTVLKSWIFLRSFALKANVSFISSHLKTPFFTWWMWFNWWKVVSIHRSVCTVYMYLLNHWKEDHIYLFMKHSFILVHKNSYSPNRQVIHDLNLHSTSDTHLGEPVSANSKCLLIGSLKTIIHYV